MKKNTTKIDILFFLFFGLWGFTNHAKNATETNPAATSQITKPLDSLSPQEIPTNNREKYWVQEGRITKDLLLGKIHYEQNPDFVKVQPPHTDRSLYLLREVNEAFTRMYKAALQDDVKLHILTAARPFYAQKTKWEEKWELPEYQTFKGAARARHLLRYWSMPGTSRHHWGTEIDLNSMKLTYYQTPIGKKTYDWLQKNASRFGFYQPYTKQDESRPYGYCEEKWHWSYKPLAQIFLQKYLELVSVEDIQGFKGAYTAQELNIIEKWVKGINPEFYR